MHNYANLLRVRVPRNPAFSSVKATLKHLPTLQNLLLQKQASYLLSWAATGAPLKCSLLSSCDLQLPVTKKHCRLPRLYSASSRKMRSPLPRHGLSWFRTPPARASVTKKRSW